MITFLRIIFLLGVCALQACTSSMSPNDNGLQSYIVKAGDTLFSIAMNYDLDYRELAASNRISPPYTIYPGDVIYLNSGIFSGWVSPRAATPIITSSPPTQQKVSPSIQYPKVVETQKNTGNAQNNGVKTLHNVNKPVARPVYVPPVVANSSSAWMWPVQGEVIKSFVAGDVLNKGMDIKNQIGTPIVAARSGEVVYAGSGLKGYGNLIIIRHDDIYISAYAHNKVMLVKEGQAINKGQKIAELGMSGTDIPKLHFEIRRQGEPINPMQLLPKK